MTSADLQLANARVEQARDAAAPPLGLLLGLSSSCSLPGEFNLQLDDHSPVLGSSGPGVAEVLVLTDFALGGALRNRLQTTSTMPTMTLSVQVDPGRWAEARSVTVPGEHIDPARTDRTLGVSGLILDDHGRCVGRAQATFALAAGHGHPLPWDHIMNVEEEAVGELVPTHLIERWIDRGTDRACATWSMAMDVAAPGQGPGDAISTIAPQDALFANRAGHVQGGVVAGLAVQAAAVTTQTDPQQLASVAVSFVAPAPIEEPLSAATEVLLSTRRTQMASTRVLDSNGGVAAIATSLFR